MISYKPLHRTLLERNLKISNVCRELGFSSTTRTKLSQNVSVALSTLVSICVYLDVPIEHVVEIKRESPSP